MNICENCIHTDFCDRSVLKMTAELSGTCRYYKDARTYQELPAYIGMKVWVPYVWVFKEIMTDLREGHVSGLQQKADKSWKIRVTRCGSVADYTVEEFHKYCFLNKEDAEKYIEEKVKELSDESRTT
jgi:hypothetical protein